MISIFYILNHDKYDFYLSLENMHEKLLGFGRMHKDKIVFYLFFWKEKINLNFFLFSNLFIKKHFRENRVFYNVSLKPDIMQNSWKNMREAHIYFSNAL
jgi:uncharacterized membrane-anchored protein YitT (DUF2179 family)